MKRPSRLIRRPLGLRGVLRISAVVLFSIATAIANLAPSFSWCSDILLTASIAGAVFTDGWLGGLLALAAAPFGLGDDREIWRGHAFGEWIEAAVVFAVMIAARRKILSLKKSQSKLRALLASMEDLILILDRDGTYTEIVPTNPGLLYRPAENLIGRRIGPRRLREAADLSRAPECEALAEIVPG